MDPYSYEWVLGRTNCCKVSQGAVQPIEFPVTMKAIILFVCKFTDTFKPAIVCGILLRVIYSDSKAALPILSAI